MSARSDQLSASALTATSESSWSSRYNQTLAKPPDPSRWTRRSRPRFSGSGTPVLCRTDRIKPSAAGGLMSYEGDESARLDDLAARAAAGDNEALNELLGLIEPRVMRICARMLPCKQD